jgi:ABC-type molybdate transport system ATPase subunit
VALAAERAPGTPVTLAIRAEDVLVALGPVAGLSARHAYAGRLLAMERTGVDVTLRCALDPGGVERLRSYFDRFWNRALVAFKSAAEQAEKESQS